MSRSMDDLDELAPHVRGYTVVWPDDTFAIPWLHSEEPGKGHVSHYLDSLPKNRRVAFPTVISRVLAEALLRRGFAYSDRLIFAEEYGEWVDGFVREPAPPC